MFIEIKANGTHFLVRFACFPLLDADLRVLLLVEARPDEWTEIRGQIELLECEMLDDDRDIKIMDRNWQICTI